MRNSQRFKNKVVLVTGGSKGIGFAVARRFLSEGARVVICSRSKENIESALRRLKRFNGKVHGETGDLSIETTVAQILEKIYRRYRRIDILVNAAGISRPARFEDISLEEWHYLLDNNLTNSFLTCKHVLKYMKKQRSGKIINLSSIAGRFRGTLAGAHYSCAKAGVIALTKQLAAEVGKYHINVNVVCPSQTKTDMLRPFLSRGVQKAIRKSIPLGYLASPEQQAEVILFLASEESSYMTGSVVDVNGGQF